jgi:hypothetical protein
MHRGHRLLDRLPPRPSGDLFDHRRARIHCDLGIGKSQGGSQVPEGRGLAPADEPELLAFFDFPAEHWLNLRTGNLFETPFATVRLRQRVTKGAGSRRKGLLMAFQLLAMAERRWRRINAAHLIPLVRAGVQFIAGEQAVRRALCEPSFTTSRPIEYQMRHTVAQLRRRSFLGSYSGCSATWGQLTGSKASATSYDLEVP